MMRSIRGRLLFGVLAAAVAILAVSGVLIHQTSRSSLVAAFDEHLRDRARSLAALVEYEDGRFEFEDVDRVLPEYRPAPEPDYFEIWTDDGRAIARSGSLGSSHLSASQGADNAGEMVITLPDGRAGRLVWITTPVRNESANTSGPHSPVVRVATAKSTQELEVQQARLAKLLGWVGLATLGLNAVVLFGVVWRGLRPVADLAAQIDRLDARQLTARVALPKAPAELRSIVEVCNQLLSRLEVAIDRERSFTADVAHELRTPLAGMRSLLEVALQNRRDPEAYQATLTECLTVTLQMQGITTQLLQLARLDRGQHGIQPVPVAIEPMLREIWAGHADAVEDKRVQAHWSCSDLSAEVLADPALLRQALANLIDNAIRYVEDRGRITLSTGTSGSEGIVQIANTGSRIAQEDASCVFERFWRGDPARTGDELHAGLGLCLARRIVEAMQGRITVTSQEGGIFMTTLNLPLAG